jgi:hypothetical protein
VETFTALPCRTTEPSFSPNAVLHPIQPIKPLTATQQKFSCHLARRIVLKSETAKGAKLADAVGAWGGP